MKTITAKDVALKAVELATAAPDHIYTPTQDQFGDITGCAYVHRNPFGWPTGDGCLFGQALVQLGVRPNAIPEGNHIAATLKHLGITDEEVTRPSHSEFTGDPLLVAMVRAQNDQDGREPWGKAIAHVEAALATEEAAA